MKNAAPKLMAVLLIGAIAAGGYLYWQNMNLSKTVTELKNDPKVIAQQEVQSTVAQVGKVVALPEGEDPVVATVTDKEKLKDQAFFAKAENGDKVLIYAKARRIYLFRPGENKLLEAAPLNIGASASASPAASGAATASPRTSPAASPSPAAEE